MVCFRIGLGFEMEAFLSCWMFFTSCELMCTGLSSVHLRTGLIRFIALLDENSSPQETPEDSGFEQRMGALLRLCFKDQDRDCTPSDVSYLENDLYSEPPDETS